MLSDSASTRGASPVAAGNEGRRRDEIRDVVEEEEVSRGAAATQATPTPSSPTSPEGERAASSVEKPPGEEMVVEQTVLPHIHANGLQDQTNYMPIRSIIVCFLSMQLTVLLYFLEQTIVSTALPTISAHFDAGRSSSFVAAAYLLTSSAMQTVWGRLSDVLGRKVTLLTCLAIFLIGSLACALAKTILQLIVWPISSGRTLLYGKLTSLFHQIFRGMQGFGGGGLLTLVLIIVSDILSLKDRGLYQGITEITIALGNGLGPPLGGVLVEKAGWRWCFWLNLPIGGVAFLILVFFLPLKAVKGSVKEKLQKIDYGGAILTLVASTLVILPLNWGGTSFPWVSGPVLGCLLSGIVLFVVFFLYEAKVPKVPVVPPFIFKRRTVSCVFFTTFLSGATTLVQIFYLPQLFQVVHGKSPVMAGVLIIPQLVTVTLFVAISGIVVSKTGQYKPLVLVGFALWTVGLGLLSTLDENSSTARIIGFELLNGAGQGQTLQTTVVAAQAAVQRSEMSVVTSVRNFVRALGGTVFLVVAASIINNTLRTHLTSTGLSPSSISSVINDPTAIWASSTSPTSNTVSSLSSSDKAAVIQGYVAGFHKLFYVHAALIGLCFVVAVVGLQVHSLTRAEEDELKQRGKEWAERRNEKGRRGRGEEKEEV
ncbi:hypothetical protein JCM8547_006738 [Rhodosporidiobolus lusitaniae]